MGEPAGLDDIECFSIAGEYDPAWITLVLGVISPEHSLERAISRAHLDHTISIRDKQSTIRSHIHSARVVANRDVYIFNEDIRFSILRFLAFIHVHSVTTFIGNVNKVSIFCYRYTAIQVRGTKKHVLWRER